MFSTLVYAVLTAAAVVAAAALPDSSSSLCVHGKPAKTGGYIIDYQEIKLPSTTRAGYILDEDWMAKHEVGDSSHYFAGSSMLPWAENKCQYTCNAIKQCVSFVGYQTPDSTPEKGEIYCHFFDALIEKKGFSLRAPNDPSKITHAYNKLCDE